MVSELAAFPHGLAFGLSLLPLLVGVVLAAPPARVVKEATPEEIRAFFASKHMKVLTAASCRAASACRPPRRP